MTTRSRIKKPRPPRPPHPLRVAFDAMPPAEQQAILDRIQQLLESQEWIFAKTMAYNPHWYCLRKNFQVDADFNWVVEQIRGLGYRSKWISPKSGKASWYIQFDIGEYFYWTMGYPVGPIDHPLSTMLINRKPLSAKASAADGTAAVGVSP